MLKKLITGILALAMCASTLTALPQGACAAEPDPDPTSIVVVDPEDPTTPIEPGEQGEPEEQGISPNCAYPEDDPKQIVI